MRPAYVVLSIITSFITSFGVKSNYKYKNNPNAPPNKIGLRFGLYSFVFDIRNSCENIEYETVGAPRRMNFEGFLFVKKGKPKRGFERKMKHIFATRWRERYHFKNKKRGDRGWNTWTGSLSGWIITSNWRYNSIRESIMSCSLSYVSVYNVDYI